MLVKDILSHPNIDEIKDEQGNKINENEEIFITSRVKTVRLNQKSVLFAEKVFENKEYVWKNIDKKHFKKY